MVKKEEKTTNGNWVTTHVFESIGLEIEQFIPANTDFIIKKKLTFSDLKKAKIKIKTNIGEVMVFNVSQFYSFMVMNHGLLDGEQFMDIYLFLEDNDLFNFDK